MRAAIAGLVVLVLLAAPALAQPAATGDFAGPVDVGGRKVHLECRGAGTPDGRPRLRLSQRRRDLDASTSAPASCRCSRPSPASPRLRLGPARAPSSTSTNRSRSDPVPMPRTAESVVAELHALLDKASVRPPYVLARALAGRAVRAALCGDLSGRGRRPRAHRRLSRIAAAPPRARAVGRLRGRSRRTPPPGLDYPDLELIDFSAASRSMARAAEASPAAADAARRHRPRQARDPAREYSAELFARGLRARLAGGPAGPRETAARHALHRGGRRATHNVQVEQPALVADAIRAVVEAVRDPGSWSR